MVDVEKLDEIYDCGKQVIERLRMEMNAAEKQRETLEREKTQLEEQRDREHRKLKELTDAFRTLQTFAMQDIGEM